MFVKVSYKIIAVVQSFGAENKQTNCFAYVYVLLMFVLFLFDCLFVCWFLKIYIFFMVRCPS